MSVRKITFRGTITADELDNPGLAADVGDVFYCTDDNECYEYYDDGPGKPFGWRPFKVDKSALVNLGLTEYEVNKMVVAQLPSLVTPAQLQEGKDLIKEYTHKLSGYYMLLCNDIHYYTVFNVDDKFDENAEDIIIECLQDNGVIQQINKAEVADAIECWVKNDKGVFMFLLFDYNWGVVQCR